VDQVVFKVVAGKYRKWRYTLRTRANAAVTTYTSEATRECVATVGDDREPVATFTATWDDAPTGKLFLELPPEETEDLTPGTYRVLLSITASGNTVAEYIGWLSVEPAPGDGEAAETLCSIDDVRRECRWIDQVISKNAHMQSDLAEQRGRAWTRLKDAIVAAYRPKRVGRYADWINTGGGIRGDSEWMREQLDAGLLLTSGSRGDRPKQITALWTIAETLRGTADDLRGDKQPYSYAAVCELRASQLLAGYVAELDLNDDDEPDLWVPLGVKSWR
jgi:hypothetical protein